MGDVIDIKKILAGEALQREYDAELERIDAEYDALVHDEWLQDIIIADALQQIDPESPVEAILLLGDGRFLVDTERIERY